jgi:hypothetical protein
MGKTMARFSGLLSCIPSHMAAWARVSFFIVSLDGASFFWANACDEKQANKIKRRKDVSNLRIIDMRLGLLLSSLR